MKDIISVITPTYNRVDYLPILFEHLLQQTSKHFEWIIIDDGSTDGTDHYINNLKADFKIRYIYQLNKGKHVALNNAIKLCNSELFFCVDSDDYLKNDAIEKVLNLWKEIKSNAEFIGIVAYRVFENDSIVGKPFPECFKIKYNKLNYHYKQNGETALIFKTQILKKYRFPIFKNEKFMSEEILYNKLDKVGFLAVMPEKIYVMRYLEDGLTNRYFLNWIKNPYGTCLLLNSKYQHIIGLNFFRKLEKRFKVLLQYDAFLIGRKIFDLKNMPNKFLCILLLPFAWLIFQIKYKKIIIVNDKY